MRVEKSVLICSLDLLDNFITLINGNVPIAYPTYLFYYVD